MDSLSTMIIVLLFCIGVLIPQTRGVPHDATLTPTQKYAEIHRACQADPSTHLDPTDLTRFDHGDDVHAATLGAHLLCLHVGMGLQDRLGRPAPNLGRLLASLASAPSEADRLGKLEWACGVLEAGSAEELAVALRRCIVENYPELEFLHDP